MGGLETEVFVDAHGAHIGDFGLRRHPLDASIPATGFRGCRLTCVFAATGAIRGGFCRSDGGLGIPVLVGAVHGLQEAVREGVSLNAVRHEARLRIDELQFVARSSARRWSRLWD